MTTMYQYTVALSNRITDHRAKDNTSALRQIRAMCRVWKDTLLQVYAVRHTNDGTKVYTCIYDRKQNN